MNEDAFDKEKIRHHVQLCDTATHKVFYDKLEYIYVEISSDGSDCTPFSEEAFT